MVNVMLMVDELGVKIGPDQSGGKTDSLPFRVANAFQMSVWIVLLKKRTDPSHMAALTPPMCRLRAEAQVVPDDNDLLHAIGWPAGILLPHDGIRSPVVALGPNRAVKVFAPMPGRIHTPRQSSFDTRPLSSAPIGKSQVSTSLMPSVLLDPSSISEILVPRPNAMRSPTGYFLIR